MAHAILDLTGFVAAYQYGFPHISVNQKRLVARLGKCLCHFHGNAGLALMRRTACNGHHPHVAAAELHIAAQRLKGFFCMKIRILLQMQCDFLHIYFLLVFCFVLFSSTATGISASVLNPRYFSTSSEVLIVSSKR